MLKINQLEKIQKFWDNQVGGFYFDRASDYLYDFFSRVKVRKSKRVLDLGCGAGRNAIMLYDLGFEIYGCDLNKKMLRATKERLPKSVRQSIIIADMINLPYMDGFFDFLVSNGVFHNAKNIREFNLAIKETSRVLKDGGCLVVNIFIKSDLRDDFKRSAGDRYLYFTKEGLPMVLLPLCELMKCFSRNKFRLLSCQQQTVTVSTGKRRVFKGIFFKNENFGFRQSNLINLRGVIDEYDKNIVRLISQRINFSKEIFKHKKTGGLPFTDHKRENDIKLSLIEFAKGSGLKVGGKTIRRIAGFLIKTSKDCW